MHASHRPQHACAAATIAALIVVVQYCTGIQVLQYMYCAAVSCVRGIRAICRWDVNQGLRVAKGIYAVGDLIPKITVVDRARPARQGLETCERSASRRSCCARTEYAFLACAGAGAGHCTASAGAARAIGSLCAIAETGRRWDIDAGAQRGRAPQSDGRRRGAGGSAYGW